mmetsp:Transcript_54571/g.152245  ORF Transcript_54571/g.152245 Transcript_54571/m.152245 type:complete len:211 (-) Transcript_54571:99-731(-)
MNRFADQVEADLAWRQVINKERQITAGHRMQQTFAAALAKTPVVRQSVRELARRRPHSAAVRHWGNGRRVGAGRKSTECLKNGDSVRISGMARREELNGRSGSIVSNVPDAAGRVCVQLGPDMPGTAGGKVMRIMQDRLLPQAEDLASTASPRSAVSCGGTSGDGHRRKSDVLEALTRLSSYSSGAPHRSKHGGLRGPLGTLIPSASGPL